MKNVIVGITGSSGFIGGALARALRARAGVKIRSFDRPRGDLLRENYTALDRFVRGCDVIVHTAAVVRGEDHEIITGNVVATHHLLAALERTKTRAKLVFLSSSAVDFSHTHPVYGRAKEFTEHMVKGFSRARRQPATVLRLTNVFGEGSRPFHTSVVATFCYQVVHGQHLTVNTKGARLMLVYVGDVLKVLVREVFVKRKKPFHFQRVYTKNIITVPALARRISSFWELKNSRSLKTKFHRDLYRTYLSFLSSGDSGLAWRRK